MGYAGGTTPSPTYRSIGDHAEMVQIAFDPAVIDYESLLELFWGGHDPFGASRSQYRAELVCEDEEQLAAARRSAERIEEEFGRSVETRLLVGQPFHLAEGYHQKWRLRRHERLFAALGEHYGSEQECIASTAAAKLNAYVGGHWVRDGLELSEVGLPAEVLDGVERFSRPRRGPGELGRRAS